MTALPWLVWMMACDGDKSTGGFAHVGHDEQQPPDDSPPGRDTGPPPDGGDDSGPPPDRDTGPREDPDADDPNTIRFVALGDAGEGNDTQYQVAAAMETVCAARGCDFAVYLGDNFYENGVESADDELFQTAFELPYEYLDFPFYVVLGNHDYGGNGLGWESWKPGYEITYSETSDKFILPDRYYSFQKGPADFFGLDTNAIVWGEGEDQDAWIEEVISESTAPWRVALGHHTYISNGSHGNAGNYEGLPWLPIVNGADFQTFFDDHLCGQVDIYLCGHDHSRQWLEATCGTEFVVSGAGAKVTEIVERDANPSYFQVATAGFMWIKMNEDSFTGVFYDEDGVPEFERTFYR